MKSLDYQIDFQIPEGKQGATGMQGPKGISGPTGPYAIEDLILIQYNDSATSSLLTISNSTVWPQKSTLYSLNSSDCTINQTGIYECTLSGEIKGNTTVTVEIINNTNNATEIIKTFPSETEEALLTWNYIFTVNSQYKIRLYATMKEVASKVESLSLLIKKIPL